MTVWVTWYWLGGGVAAVQDVVHNWPVTVTMIFGSFIAGATSEGGGAVAFPVFTKVLEISPANAAVFSLAIQSVGMTAAALLILFMRVNVEWRVIRWASLGGVPGIMLGALWLAPHLPPTLVKMSFTVLVTSFALTLFMLNRGMRLCHEKLESAGIREHAVLLLAGFAGGMLSGLVGNGIDIVTFSLMVLLFRISEKVATPTSVILMAINSLIGFALHTTVTGGFNSEVQAYWMAAIPVVVIGAPAGAILCTLLNRVIIARILIGLIMIELISSLVIIPLSRELVIASAVLLATFSLLYFWMYRTQTYEPQGA